MSDQFDPTRLQDGDMVVCDKGTQPGTFRSLNRSRKATANETTPLVNIPLFGMCNSPAHPQGLAATSAAQGVSVPAQCMPNIPSQWLGDGAQGPGGSVGAGSVCVCVWGGQIKKV